MPSLPPSPSLPVSQIPCCVEAPERFLSKARYAVETLLLGLGLAPRWTSRDGLDAGGLYYGPQPEAAPAALGVRLADATVAFFDAPRSLDPAHVGRLEWDGTAWPLPFPSAGGEAGPDVFAS
ncbi:MAG TPA: hypothetical protein VD838_17645, partial [Anaeromyxobacteraceae bacterium]|nr:hypothetical protein [Anaeromyxobacteraceae bacterium]